MSLTAPGSGVAVRARPPRGAGPESAGAGGAAKAPDGEAGTTAPSRTSSRTARPTATMCSQKPRSEKRGQVHTPVMTSSCQNRCTSQRASPPTVAVAPPTARLWTQTASTWPSPRS